MAEAAASARGLRGVPRATWLGILATVVLYLGAAVYAMVTLPWRGTADAFAHMDYVYQVHHRTLPEPFGYAYRKVSPRSFGVPNPDRSPQWVSSHPPLYYAVASLVMGRHLDAGDWRTAMIRGRTLNIFFGLCCVLALAWAGWKLGGRRRAVLAVALPAAVCSWSTFIRFSAEVYNDILVTLCSIVAITLSCVMLREGFSRGRLSALLLACACGIAVKATFVFALVLAASALLVALAVRWWRQQPAWLVLLRSAAASAAFAVAAVLPTFWFYLHNHERSGSWVRSAEKFAIDGRRQRTAEDVLTDDTFWLFMPRELLGPAWRGFWAYARELSEDIFFVAAAAALVAAWRSGWLARLRRVEMVALAWLVVMAHYAGLMLAQFEHAVGWGQYSSRYFLPGLLSIGLLLAGPISMWPRLARLAVPALAALMALSVVVYSMTYLDRAYRSLVPGEGSWLRLVAAVEGNGLMFGWAPAMIAVMGFGIGLLAVSMSMLARPVGTAPPR